MVDQYCARCAFLGEIYGMPCCNYIEITGHSRGCLSGEGCDRRVKGRRRSMPSLFTFSSNGIKKEEKPKRDKRPIPLTREERLARDREKKRKQAEANKAMLAGRQRAILVAYKEANGLTIRTFAEKLGVNISTVEKWIIEHTKANWDKLAEYGIKKPDDL